MRKNSQNFKMLKCFLSGFAISDTFFKGDVHRNACKSIHDLSSASTGWFISNFLVNTGRIIFVRKGENGAYLYKRAY